MVLSLKTKSLELTIITHVISVSVVSSSKHFADLFKIPSSTVSSMSCSTSWTVGGTTIVFLLDRCEADSVLSRGVGSVGAFIAK